MTLSKMLRSAMIAASVMFLAVPAYALPKVGAPAPEFSGTDSDGKIQRLSDYKGKVVVLEWTNPECPFVKKFYNSGKMQELQKIYTHKGVVWLSVNSSAEGKQGHLTAEQATQIRKDNNTESTATILDASGEIGRLYGAKTTPHMFVIAQDGNVAYMGAIDDKPTADKEDIKDAKNYVVEALDAVMAGRPVETSSIASYGCNVKY